MSLITQELPGGVTKASLAGRIDVAAIQAMRLQLTMVSDMARSVVFDLTEVSFIASMGMRGIIACAKSVQARRGKAAMFGPPPDVRDVITITGVDVLIPLYGSEAEACAAVRAR